MERLVRRKPALFPCDAFCIFRKQIRICTDAVAIGNALHCFDFLCSPFPACGFQHPAFLRVYQNKCIFVCLGHQCTCLCFLSILLQQSGNDTDGFPRSSGPLQGKPQHVHTQKTVVLFRRHAGAFCFIADHQSFFIVAHFKAPNPIGSGSHNGIGLSYLGDGEVGHLQKCVFFVFSAFIKAKGLGLSGGPVAVFCKSVFSVCRSGCMYGNGIT